LEQVGRIAATSGKELYADIAFVDPGAVAIKVDLKHAALGRRCIRPKGGEKRLDKA
jgi:hypothetical protein